MTGSSLEVGKRLSLHHNGDGWRIIGLPDETHTLTFNYVSGPNELLTLYVAGCWWHFEQLKWLGKEHLTALLTRKDFDP